MLYEVITAETGAAGSIAAIATCGQMHGPVGLDEAGEREFGQVEIDLAALGLGRNNFV